MKKSEFLNLVAAYKCSVGSHRKLLAKVSPFSDHILANNLREFINPYKKNEELPYINLLYIFQANPPTKDKYQLLYYRILAKALNVKVNWVGLDTGQGSLYLKNYCLTEDFESSIAMLKAIYSECGENLDAWSLKMEFLFKQGGFCLDILYSMTKDHDLKRAIFSTGENQENFNGIDNYIKRLVMIRSQPNEDLWWQKKDVIEASSSICIADFNNFLTTLLLGIKNYGTYTSTLKSLKRLVIIWHFDHDMLKASHAILLKFTHCRNASFVDFLTKELAQLLEVFLSGVSISSNLEDFQQQLTSYFTIITTRLDISSTVLAFPKIFNDVSNLEKLNKVRDLDRIKHFFNEEDLRFLLSFSQFHTLSEAAYVLFIFEKHVQLNFQDFSEEFKHLEALGFVGRSLEDICLVMFKIKSTQIDFTEAVWLELIGILIAYYRPKQEENAPLYFVYRSIYELFLDLVDNEKTSIEELNLILNHVWVLDWIMMYPSLFHDLVRLNKLVEIVAPVETRVMFNKMLKGWDVLDIDLVLNHKQPAVFIKVFFSINMLREERDAIFSALAEISDISPFEQIINKYQKCLKLAFLKKLIVLAEFHPDKLANLMKKETITDADVSEVNGYTWPGQKSSRSIFSAEPVIESAAAAHTEKLEM